MAHPFFHSVSSTRKLGGVVEDFLPLHSWMDATKAHYAQCSHRALRHSREGIDLTMRIHGRILKTSVGAVSVREVAEQHVIEDCGFIPTTAQWLERFTVQAWMTEKPHISAEELAAESVRNFGGAESDYLPIHHLLDGDGAFTDPQFMAIRHHSEGCFLVEEVFGVFLTNADGRKVPVRFITEQHLKTQFGRIPTVQDWLKWLRPVKWMRSVGDKQAGQPACGNCACRPGSVT